MQRFRKDRLSRSTYFYAMDPEREKLIHKVWSEQGQWRWQPALHGLGQPLHIRDLTFRITTVAGPDGKHKPAVECEGVIVDRSP